MQRLKFSILIPVKSINDYVRETVPHIQGLSYDNWEVFVLPNNDEPHEWDDARVKVVSTGRVGPGAKRDFGANLATGEILVFLDDDSYPAPNLLELAEKNFSDPEIVALGGPAITPPSAGFSEHVSGAVFLSKFSGGAPERYVSVGKKRYIDDWPSVNLMVRKSVFINIGGFDTEFWPGEDTKLCLKLVKSGSGKIMYDPELIVWHHRRKNLLAHLEQVGAYGKHRGFFAKKYPETSLRIGYFMPSFFLFWMVCTVFLVAIDSGLLLFFEVGLCVYGLAMLKAYFDIRKFESQKIAIATMPYIFLTHCWYGMHFVYGLFASNLVSKLR